jgi:hypothetical protein
VEAGHALGHEAQIVHQLRRDLAVGGLDLGP